MSRCVKLRHFVHGNIISIINIGRNILFSLHRSSIHAVCFILIEFLSEYILHHAFTSAVSVGIRNNGMCVVIARGSHRISYTLVGNVGIVIYVELAVGTAFRTVIAPVFIYTEFCIARKGVGHSTSAVYCIRIVGIVAVIDDSINILVIFGVNAFHNGCGYKPFHKTVAIVITALYIVSIRFIALVVIHGIGHFYCPCIILIGCNNNHVVTVSVFTDNFISLLVVGNADRTLYCPIVCVNIIVIFYSGCIECRYLLIVFFNLCIVLRNRLVIFYYVIAIMINRGCFIKCLRCSVYAVGIIQVGYIVIVRCHISIIGRILAVPLSYIFIISVHFIGSFVKACVQSPIGHFGYIFLKRLVCVFAEHYRIIHFFFRTRSRFFIYKLFHIFGKVFGFGSGFILIGRIVP